MSKTKVLFVLKRRQDYNSHKHSTHIGMSTGLYNSANFMNEMLLRAGIDSNIAVVVDNNEIDRVVTKHRPSHVIIEALWVTPSKFSVLSKLHPKVKWIIRLHSELPFLANEGIAMDWIGDYLDFKNVIIAVNAPRTLDEIKFYAKNKEIPDKEIDKKVIYLPNYYPQKYKDKELRKDKEHIDICCFGAIRPLKNHLVQAIAAVKFADKKGKKLRFHINLGRVEGRGEPILKNLQCLFAQLEDTGHQLIEHEWTPREEFLEICSKMDIGMQCSISETFNIVAADLISQGVPVVGSKEIPWINPMFCADPVDSKKIEKAIERTYCLPKLNLYTNQILLKWYTNKSRRIWVNYFKNNH